jgi:hypothetical protein
VNYDDVGFCLSDTDSAISQASDAWEELDETCGLSLPDLSAEQARNHRQEQQDEGVEELLETFEKSLHISIPGILTKSFCIRLNDKAGTCPEY